MGQHVIELVDLTKKYGDYAAVDHLNLSIKKGEVFGLLGPNGAGKSTTILMMLGLTDPTAGSVKVCGIDSTSNPIEVKRKVGYLPEDVGFYTERSALENLVYTAQLNGMSKNEATEKADLLLDRVGLSDDKQKKAGKYSRGMRQRLGFADILIKNPEVVIMDEPTLGIDPEGVREFLKLIVQLSKEEGLTVLLSSHNLYQVQQVCDRVGLFVRGKLIAEGDIHSLSKKLFTNQPFIVEAGVSFATSNASAEATPTVSIEQMQKTLKNVEGVTDIKRSNDMFHIGCARDATQDIARAIVTSGAILNYLRKKEYRLDDIYHRYFEGGEDRG